MNLMELIDAYAETMYLRRERHEARTAVLEAVEKLERDAARWNAVMNFSGDLTLRLHHLTRRDHLTALVDKAMEATNGQGD